MIRLLPKLALLRLAPAEEPPAEEAHEAAYDDDRGDGDPRDDASGEAALVVRINNVAIHEIAEDGAGTARWGCTASTVGNTDNTGLTLAARNALAARLVVPASANVAGCSGACTRGTAGVALDTIRLTYNIAGHACGARTVIAAHFTVARAGHKVVAPIQLVAICGRLASTTWILYS